MSEHSQPQDAHFRLCATRNPGAALLYFLCTAFVTIIAVVHYGKPSTPFVFSPDWIFDIFEFAILIWMITYNCPCIGEKIVFGLWAASPGLALLTRLIPQNIKAHETTIELVSLIAWFVATIVSAGMLGYSIRVARSNKE